jgi:hypothetical protein
VSVDILPVHKDLRKLVRRALKQGFTCEQRGSKHFLLTSPSGATVTIGSTANAGGVRDAERHLRRAGMT